MLKQLTLHNFVLVESLDIAFDGGLTTITGESGAGKSILLNALGLLLGERARTEVIRPGADKADVCAEFDLQAQPGLRSQLADDELAAAEDVTCLVRRVVSANGRSRAFVNGIPVTSQYLRQMGDALVDIHGQNEHQRLADRNTQLTLLDDYAALQKQARDVAALHKAWQADLKQLHTLQDRLEAATDRQSLLTYQLEELDDFDLQPGEFDRLATEHKRLSQANDVLSRLQHATEALDELDVLRHSVRDIESIDDDHSALQAAQASLSTAINLLDDAQRDLSRYQDQVVVDPAALQELEERLNTAQDLARKHRIEPDELPAHTARLHEELHSLSADRSSVEALQQQAQRNYDGYLKKARTLSSKRQKAAPRFATAVSRYMQQLGISKGAFDVAFETAETETGLDRVEFMVTTNPNFPPGPLTRIASGGEQTRIALSIQIVAAQNSALPCLILDEADVGVGGTTADTVGRILRELGAHTQVICITHAPQVAALGNHHYRVKKDGDNTQIQALAEDSRIEELARMLAGADITQKTRDYAQTLLDDARPVETGVDAG